MFLCQASLDRSVRLWDARNLGAGSGPSGIKGMKHVTEMPHFRSVNSAHFSPTGEWMATVGQDDKIRLYQDLAEASGPHVMMYNAHVSCPIPEFYARGTIDKRISLHFITSVAFLGPLSLVGRVYL